MRMFTYNLNIMKTIKNQEIKIIFAAILLCVTGCSKEEVSRDEPVIPVYLAGIESVNVNNEGKYPFTTAAPVKKEAFMIGIRWITDNSNPDGDQAITGPIGVGVYSYQNITGNYSKRIYCNTVFNSRNPAGANVSQYFKAVTYLPTHIDEGFVLLVAPDPGDHSFKVVYTNNGNGDSYEYDTELIKLY